MSKKITFKIRATVSLNCEMELPDELFTKEGKLKKRMLMEYINDGNGPHILSENYYDFHGRTIEDVEVKNGRCKEN